jgi:uncharacterized protein YcfL
MKSNWKTLLLGAFLLAGCSAAGGKAPKAVIPEDSVDFGDVPVVSDMNQAKTKTFVIKNEGTGNLQLSDLQVKTLEGC